MQNMTGSRSVASQFVLPDSSNRQGSSATVPNVLVPKVERVDLPGMARSILYATSYQFLPAGLQRVRELVNEKLRKESLFATHDYNRHRRAFRISCNANDEAKILVIFHQVIKDFLDSELLDEYDDERPSRMIAHVFYDRDKKEIFPDGEGYDEAEYDITKSETEVQESDTESSLDTDCFGFECDWQLDADDLEIEMVIPLAARSHVEFLTGTKLVGDLMTPIIQISGKRRADCESACHKLDVLRKYYGIRRFNFNHVFYSEVKNDFRVSLILFPEIKRGFVGTTLVDPSFLQVWPYGKLHELYSARCCGFAKLQSRYTLTTTRKLAPMVNLQDKEERFQCWQGYIYPSKGNTLLDFNQQVSQPAIKIWLERDLPETTSETLSQMIKDLVKPPKPDSQTRETSNKGMDKALKTPLSSLEEPRGVSREAASQPLTIIRSKIRALSPTHEDENLMGFSPDKSGGTYKSLTLKNLNTAIQTQSLLDSDDTDLPLPLFGASQSILPRPLLEYNEDGPLRPLLAGHGRLSQPLLDGNRPRSSHPKTSGEKTNHFDPEFGLFAPENKAGDSWLTYKNEDMEKAKSKKDKRKAQLCFSPATNQTVNGLIDPNQYFMDEMRSTLEAILASLRDWQGEIVLEAQFGRVLIRRFNNRIVGSSDRPLSHEARQVRDLLLTNRSKVGFTKLTTMLPADMETVVGMQDEANLPIWGESLGNSVIYELFCCHHEIYDEPCKPFVIEMNAETFDTKAHTAPTQAGGVYVHCTLRNWDYFVSACGTRSLEEEYGGLAQEIADTTYIAPNLTEPGLTFALTSTVFHFPSIRVRRLSQYRSRDEKSILHVTEIQDLEIECVASEEELVVTAKMPDKTANKTEEETTMDKIDPRRWYEVAIRSVAAQEAFVENVELELGEETKWSEETLLSEETSTLADICFPANYMIKKLDGMGFHNKNGACADLAPAAAQQFW